MLERRSAAVFFLAVLMMGVLWPIASAAASCGSCCPGHPSRGKAGGCGTAAPGTFSLCCLNAQSSLPVLGQAKVALALTAQVEPLDEDGAPPPDPSGVLHVPRPILT